MEKIEINEYIRTTDGIKKIIKVNEGSNATYYGKYIVEPKYKGSNSINAKNIIKHSFNIIDLIEEGDYVNGQKVVGVSNVSGWIDTKEDVIHKGHIKTILTKEQFQAMEYEVK